MKQNLIYCKVDLQGPEAATVIVLSYVVCRGSDSECLLSVSYAESMTHSQFFLLFLAVHTVFFGELKLSNTRRLLLISLIWASSFHAG